MGDLLLTIKDVTTRQIIEGQGAHFVWRGLAMPIDIFMEGVVRYGKKVEYVLPIIAPDNRYVLLEDAVYATDRVVVDRTVSWIDVGGYVTVNKRELHRVEDVSDNTIILATTLLADHPDGTYVFHYSDPIQVEGIYAAGRTVINVDVTYFLVRGDVICISASATQDISFVEYVVTDLFYVGMANGLHQYQVVLDKPTHRALANSEIIQLRAYPAYVSPILGIPQVGTAQIPIVGPYLVDWYSEPFINQLDVTEYQTLQRFNDARLAIGPPVAIEKNHQVLSVPIRSDQFMWWTRVCGSIKYDDTIHKLIAIPNVDGYWWLKHDCRPYVDVPAVAAKGLIITVAKASLANNDQFRIPDDEDARIFEYKVDGTYVATPTAVATATITINAFPAGWPNNNDTFTLDDGFGTVVTFEFKQTVAFLPADPTYRTVDVTTALNPTDVAIAMEQAINAVGTIGITAVNLGGVLTLSNTTISQNGNTTILTSPAVPAWGAVVSFAGGTDDVETIDVSAVVTSLEVAQLTAAAINRSDLHVKTIYPTVAGSVVIISTVLGPEGNGVITESVLNPGFIVQGMSGGFGGTAWNFQITSEYDALLRVRLYPNAWQDYNLVAGVASTISVTLAPTDDPIERFDILLKSTAGSEIQMGDWNIRGARVSALQHSYVAHVMGDYNFASSGLMVKPLFHSLEDLRVRYDNGDVFDAGGVRF